MPHIAFRSQLLSFDGSLLRLALLGRHILTNTFRVRYSLIFLLIFENDFTVAVEFKVLRIDMAMTTASLMKVLESLTGNDEHSSDRIIV